MPTVFIPKEIVPNETRVAAVPETVKKLVKLGLEVAVEKGAGDGAHIPDKEFQDAGAKIVADAASGYGAADVVVKLNPPQPNEADMIKEGAVLVSYLYPAENQDLVKKLTSRKISPFVMDMMPRTTRAQALDAISSQANIAGYKAVIMAAMHLHKIFPLMMTPSGTIKPARVVIMGAGVAGLQAIATAKRLGAIVEVSDVRPAVKEQVESLGGRFIEVPTEEAMETSGGYAKEQSEDFLRKQREIVRKHIVEADVVITTALIPGKPAPRLIGADMVKEMRSGSVIVDLAAERGGNCELTEKGQVVVKEDVTIDGTLNIPGTVSYHSSEMYARNCLSSVQLFFDKEEKKLNLDFEDDIVDAVVIAHQGSPREPGSVAKAKAEAEQKAEATKGGA